LRILAIICRILETLPQQKKVASADKQKAESGLTREIVRSALS
jgi:hypothetical protein